MKRLAIFFFAIWLPLALYGSSGQQVIDGILEPAGYVQVTDVSTAVGVGTIPTNTKLTLVQAEGQDVRWRDDGTDPTAGVGMLLEDGQTLVYNGNPTALKIIQVTTTAKLNISFYR
jgi:hypothetical protein